jgi:DNA-3-methyladenine glycosylase
MATEFVLKSLCSITHMPKLPRSFYTRDQVLEIAKELLGKFLVTRIDGHTCSGMIVETEAYAGIIDRASHAYNDRRTKRTEIMYAAGGTAYVYLCYGIHHLFNVVTNRKDHPHAVLIRALEPVEGIEVMLARRQKQKLDYTLTKGPGALSKALGIEVYHTGENLLGKTIWIEDRKIKIQPQKIYSGRRVGVDYAGDHASWPYRFYVNDNPWVSKHRR